MEQFCEALQKELIQYLEREKGQLSYEGFDDYLMEEIRKRHPDNKEDGTFNEEDKRIICQLTVAHGEIKKAGQMQDNVKKYLAIENERREYKQREKNARQHAIEYESKCISQFRENPGKKDEWGIPVCDITVSKDMLEPESIYYSYNGEKEYYDAYFFTDRVIVNGKVVIEGEVETIPVASFKGCQLEELIIEEGVKRITPGYCKQYESDGIDIRYSMKGCRRESVKGWEARKNCGAFCRCSRLKQVTVPRSLEYIGSNVFRRCISLTSVHGLQDSHVTEIGRNAFAVCNKLQEIEFPLTLCEIGDGAFQYCSSLRSVHLKHTQVQTVSSELFKKASGMECITLPQHLETIGYEAFLDCKSLQGIEFPSSLKDISGNAFKGCSSLCDVTLEYTQVEQLCSSVFQDCVKLEKITLVSGLKEIGEKALMNTAIQELFLPESVEMIQADAFLGCRKLKKIHIKNASQKELLEQCYVEPDCPLTEQTEILTS